MITEAKVIIAILVAVVFVCTGLCVAIAMEPKDIQESLSFASTDAGTGVDTEKESSNYLAKGASNTMALLKGKAGDRGNWAKTMATDIRHNNDKLEIVDFVRIGIYLLMIVIPIFVMITLLVNMRRERPYDPHGFNE